MFSLRFGHSPLGRTVIVRPAWLLAPLGLALCAAIGLVQGTQQNLTAALTLLGVGLALLWLGLVVARPEIALLFYTLVAVNLNSASLPLTVAGARVSPDIVLASLLIVGVLVRVLTTRRPLFSLSISLPYLVFLAVPLITLPWSPTPVESVRGILRFVSYYALMWLIVDTIRGKAQLRRMVLAIILSTALPVAIGLYQALSDSGQFIRAGELFNRIYGLTGGPYTLAFYLVMVTPLILIFFLGQGDQRDGSDANTERWRFHRLWLGLLLSLAGIALVLTYIRGAWIALVIALMLLGVLRSSLRYRQLLLTIPAAVGVVLLTFAPALERLQQATDPGSTLFGRIELWRLALDWWLANPINVLAGVGMKAFEYHNVLLAGPTLPGLYWQQEARLIGSRPHNELFGFLLDVGLIGTIALAVAFFILTRLAITIHRRSQDADLRLVALSFLIGFAGLLVGSLSDNVFSQPAVTVYFWIMAGLVMAIDRHLMRDA